MSRLALFLVLTIEFTSVAAFCLFGYALMGVGAALFWAGLDAWLWDDEPVAA